MKSIAIIVFCIAGAAAFCKNAHLTQEVWKDIKLESNDIFYKILKENPQIQTHFPQFAGKDLELVKLTLEFANQASQHIDFITTINKLLTVPRETPTVKKLLTQIGLSHRNRNITSEEFDVFHNSFHDYLYSHEKWNKEIEDAWNCEEKEIHRFLYGGVKGKPVN